MRQFCVEVENDHECRDNLIKKFQNMVDWYREFHFDHSARLKDWLEKIYSGESYSEGLTIKTSKNTVEVPSDNMEVLVKIILSLYDKGPTPYMEWFHKNLSMTFHSLIEILNQQLQKHNEGQNLALAVLLESRSERNGTVHRNDLYEVSATIRQMNIFREMLILVDSELEGQLERFEYPSAGYIDIGALLSDERLNPKERTLVLITGSLHDIDAEKRALLANVPWNMVIDLDAASDFGGLRASVNDKSRINDKKWDMGSIPDPAKRSFDGNITEWYSCGDLLNIEFRNNDLYDNSKFEYKCVTNRYSIADTRDRYAVPKLFSQSVKSLKNSKYPITFLFIHDNLAYANNIIATSNNELPSDFYSFFGVYYQNLSKIQSLASYFYFDYPNKDLDTFNFFRCDLHSFFYELSKFKNQLPVLKASDPGRTIPSKDGNVTLEINRAQTLASFADVLYNDCGNCDLEESKRNKDAFYRGEKAAWSVFKAPDGAIALFENMFWDYSKQIKERLEKAMSYPDNTVMVYHKPGIGGSTFIRRLGYSLHDDYPIICVRQEYKQIGINAMAEELKKLYDNLKKGILILADDMDASNVEQLGRYLARSQSRPFCILTGQRAYSTNNKFTLSLIDDQNYEELKRLYKSQSPLSREELEEKDDNINSVLTSDMRVPFIIALYYLEKDFNGITGYVDKTLKNCPSDRERKVISYAALLNIYNLNYPLPNDFAMWYLLGTLSGKSFLNEKKYANSILLKADGNRITTKHYLISEEILRQTAKELYHLEDSSNYKLYLSNFAFDFIEDYFKFLSKARRFNDDDNALIKWLFINSKDGDDKFSKFIEDIGFNEKSEAVLNKLVKDAEKLFVFCPEEDKDILYVGLAHFYGHLGRFYHTPNNPRKNIEKSIECAEKAVENMDNGRGCDYRIYHMCGAAYQRKLYDKLEKLKYAYDSISPEEKDAEVNEAEELFGKACEMFDNTVKHGGYQYGCLSELELYIDFVVKMYVGEGEHRTSLLTQDKQDAYKGEIGSLFDMVSSIDLINDGKEFEDQLRAKYDTIIVNDKDDINYYQGLVDSARSSRNPEKLFRAMFGLLYARLRKWEKSEGDDKKAESRNIMKILDEICSESVPDNYHAKFRMVSAYNQWLYFARLNDKQVGEGIVIAERWVGLSKKLGIDDPRPYYNEYVLRYLDAMDGFTNDIGKAEELRGLCSRIAELSNASVFGKKITIRDVLVEPSRDRRGMGRLYPCKRKDDVTKELTLYKVEGNFDRVEAKMGIIKVKKPIQWQNREAKFAMRSSRTTLTESHFTHSVEFYGAFTYEQMVVYNDVVADITSGENIETQYRQYFSQSNNNSESQHTVAASWTRSSMSTNRNTSAVFYPIMCFFDEYTGKHYLNGYVEVDGERKRGGFPVEQLKRLNSSIFDLEAEANKIINAKGDCGIPVICFEKSNGSYGIDVEKSISSYDGLFDESVDGASNAAPLSSAEKADYSFLDKKEGKFIPTGKQNKKSVSGRFECEGENYEATLRCDGAKACSDIIAKGVVDAVVSYTAGGKIIVKPII